jgi:hypothetical protein
MRASILGIASQGYGWVYFFRRTSPLLAKPGSPAAVLMLQKLHYPGHFTKDPGFAL